MPVSQVLNSKGTIKKNSTNDIPFSGLQPVIASAVAVSTSSQTVINLSFSVVATGTNANTDIFWLFIDGKKLTLGSANDYTFTAIAADGTSSQVTLNFAIPAGLNIQAFKLGLKKEIEFLTDNRFTQLYEAEQNGFQGFVNTTLSLAATTTVGTPAAGTFYSTISKRANVVDISQDLRASMGIERISIQSIYDIQNESGPNGEKIYGAVNDDRGLIRFIGTWTNTFDTLGARPASSGTANVDSIEITFFGTGINLLDAIDSNNRAFTYTVDGGSVTAGSYPASGSASIDGRNYATNAVLPVVSGLALGVHTVRIIASGTINKTPYGFEVINSASSINVNPGIGYTNGQKLTLAASSTQAYNSSFESGTLGTRGGRVLVYQKADGTIGKAVTPVNASSALTASADHTNEEMVRQYHFREFGASRADDFSLMTSATIAAAFTLDDGTTTLVTSGSNINNGGLTLQTNGAFTTLTFVGTGLDIVLSDANNGGSDTFTYQIDGGTAVAWPYTAGSTVVRTQKFVSGLPYGTHTFRINRVTATTWSPGLIAFKVYQPKKPTIPAGAIELADYNVMATFIANATAGSSTISTGILRKVGMREFVYTGTWTTPPGLDTNAVSGFIPNNASSGATFSYTFFGTGFDYRFEFNSGVATNFTISVDGSSNLSGFTTSSYLAAGMTFTASTGVVSGTSGTLNYGNGVVVSGLALGIHTVKVTQNTNTGQVFSDSIDVITPIHSTKSNLMADLQNTLPVGSNALSDNRKVTPVKDSLPATKAWVQALAITSNPTTSSTSLVPLPDMSVTIKTTGGALDIQYSVASNNSGAGAQVFNQIFIDGVAIGTEKFFTSSVASAVETLTDSTIVPVSAGVHRVDIYWRVNGATGQGNGTNRNLKVREI